MTDPRKTGEPNPQQSGRKAATQARILEAAVTLFSARGFERTSVSAIADRAGVSRAAVFWHFGDKATLFQESFKALLIPFVDMVKSAPPTLEPRKRYFELFAVYEQFVIQHRERIETMVRWVMESKMMRDQLRGPLFALHEHFATELQESLEELTGDVERAKSLSAALIALLDGGLLISFLDPDEEKRELRRQGVRAIAEALLDQGTEQD
jgi:AcrR family transcriptional regulator